MDTSQSGQVASSRPLWRIDEALRFVIAAAAVLLAVWLLSDVLTVVFAAALLATILHGAASLLRRAVPIPYWLALLVVVVAIAAALGLLGWRAGPGLVTQAQQLRDVLVSQLGALHDRIAAQPWGHSVLEQVPSWAGGSKPDGTDLGGMPSRLAGSVVGFLGTAFGLFGTIAVVVIAALYLAAAPATYVNGALRLVAREHRGKARDLCLTAGRALWLWSAGQALDMLVVGLLSGVGLWLIGVPLALVLGVIAGLFNFVPYIGAIVGSLPAVLIAFSVGVPQGLETIALYLVIQGFEGNVMAPLIQKRAVDLPPGLTILSQTAFGAIFGIPGLIFATPLTALLLAVMGEATAPLDPEDRL